MTLANRLKQVRGTLSQSELSAICGVSQRTVGYYEKGERTPDVDFIKHICTKLNISLNWLVWGTGSMQADAPSTGPDSEKNGDMSPLFGSENQQHTKNITTENNKSGGMLPFLETQQEINNLNRELRDLLRENGNLRVELERTKMDVERRNARITELERELVRVLQGEETSPMASAG